MHYRWISKLLISVIASFVLQAGQMANADTFADNFDAVGYNNNDGNRNWAGSWDEGSDDDDPADGDIYIESGELILKDDGNRISRYLDLSAYSSATISFNYRESGFDDNDDWVGIYLNDGSGWDRVDRFRGNFGSGNYSFDMTAYITSNTGVRFRTSGDLGNNDFFYVDNLLIDATPIAPPSMDHFAISHDQVGVSCEEESIVITAHDDDDNLFATYEGTVIISAYDSVSSTNQGSWTLLSGNNPGSFMDLGNGQAQYQFVAADNGSITLGYTINQPASVNFNITDGTYSENGSEDPILTTANTVSLAGNVRDEFTASPGSFRDNFSSSSYSRNDGTLTWATNWIETDPDGNGASGGDVRVSGGQLELTGNNLSGGSLVRASAERELNLSSYSQAYLRLRMRSTTVEGDDNITVSVSSNGGSSWTELTRLYNDILVFRPFTFDISAYISSNTRIRFRIEDESGSSCCYGPSDEILEVDDVEVFVDGSGLYDNNDGSLSWSGSWQESDGDGPLTGEVSVYDDTLILYGDSNATVTAARAFDLSSFDQATLTFDYAPEGSVDGSDEFFVQAYSGSTGWQTLQTFSGSSGGSANIDLADYLEADAQIRFVVDDPGTGGSCCYDSGEEYVAIDNVDIEVFTTQECASCTLGSFAITQPTYGLACPSTRATVGIQAMCDDGVTVKEDYVGTVNLTTDENALSEFYLAASGGSTVTSVDFDGTESGVRNVYLFHRNENSDLRVTANDAAENVTTTAGTGTDFRTQGFAIEGEADFTCGGSNTLTLRAVGQVKDQTDCQTLSGFDGDKEMKAWFTVNVDPTESPGSADDVTSTMTMNGVPIDATSLPLNNNLDLNFEDGSATVEIGYLNAGEILSVNVKHDEPPYNETSPPNALEGNTETPFIVNPQRVNLSVVTPNSECTPPYEECSKFVAAGNEFSVQLQAQCSDSIATVATNYQAEMIQLSRSLVAPDPALGGSLGTLGESTVDIEKDDLGTKQINQTISEVGVFSLTASPPAYFGRTVDSTTAINIGRFFPAYLSMSVNSPSFAAPSGCPPPSSWTFAYQSQSFNYNTKPIITVKGMNALDLPTLNYDGDFFLFMNIAVQDGRSYTDNAGAAPVLNFVGQDASISFGTTYDGEGTVTINDTSFSYDRANTSPIAADGPFNTDITLNLAKEVLTDGDACFQTNAASVCEDGLSIENILGSEIRYGRLRFENAFGPEVENLIMPISVEYWDGAAWQLNTADTCTVVEATTTTLADFTDNLDAGETEVEVDGSTSGSATLSGGQTELLELTAPGNTNEGSVNVELDVPAWLDFDWDGDATVDSPKAQATFGQYRGHDRIIYWREIVN